MSIDESTMSATESALTIEGSAKTKKKRPTPAEQDVELANFISQSRVTIETILTTPEILALLPKRYTVAKLNEGMALQSTAKASDTAAGQAPYATALEDLGYDAAGRSDALATATRNADTKFIRPALEHKRHPLRLPEPSQQRGEARRGERYAASIAPPRGGS